MHRNEDDCGSLESSHVISYPMHAFSSTSYLCIMFPSYLQPSMLWWMIQLHHQKLITSICISSLNFKLRNNFSHSFLNFDDICGENRKLVIHRCDGDMKGICDAVRSVKKLRLCRNGVSAEYWWSKLSYMSIFIFPLRWCSNKWHPQVIPMIKRL